MNAHIFPSWFSSPRPETPVNVVSMISDGVVCFGGKPLPYRFPTDEDKIKQANYVNAINTFIRFGCSSFRTATNVFKGVVAIG